MSPAPARWVVAAGTLAAACIPLTIALAHDQDAQPHSSAMSSSKDGQDGRASTTSSGAYRIGIGGRWIVTDDGALRRVDGKPATEADVAAAAAELRRVADGLDDGSSNMHRRAANMTGPAAVGAAGMHAAAEQMHERANDARALAARLRHNGE